MAAKTLFTPILMCNLLTPLYNDNRLLVARKFSQVHVYLPNNNYVSHSTIKPLFINSSKPSIKKSYIYMSLPNYNSELTSKTNYSIKTSTV